MRLRPGALAGALLVSALGLTGPAPAGAVDGGDLDTWEAVTLDLPNGAAAYDPTRDVLLVGVAGTVPTLGNHLVELDPRTGALGRDLALVGSPHTIAVSDDGTRAYVGFGESAALVVEVDLETFTEVRRFPIGRHSTNGPLGAGDLAVVPGRSDVVAVALVRSWGFPEEEGVAVFEAGERRPRALSSSRRIDRIAFGDDPATLYATGDGLVTAALATDGLTESGHSSLGTSGDPHVDESILISGSGRAIDVTTTTQIGTFGRNGPVAVDRDADHTYFLAAGVLTRHDTTTQIELDRRTIGPSPARELVATDQGLAALTADHMVLLGPEVTGTEFSLPSPPASIRRGDPVTADVDATALAPSPNRPVIYAATTDADEDPQAIVEIDARTGERGRALFVGGTPHVLAVSDDGRVLFVGHADANRVTEIDLGAFWIRRQVRTPDRNQKVTFARELTPVPGANDRYLVGLGFASTSPSHAGVALVAAGSVRPTITPTHTGPEALAFGEDPGEAFGASTQSSSYTFYRIAVDDDGPAITASHRAVVLRTNTITWQDGLLYTDRGAVVDPDLAATVGQFTVQGPAAPIPGADRTLIVDDRDLVEAASGDQADVAVTPDLLPADGIGVARTGRSFAVVDVEGGVTLLPIAGRPAAPEGFAATRAPLAVDLTWSPPPDDGGSAVTGYRIHRDGELVHETDGPVLTYRDTGLTEGAVHEYEVTAVNQYGEGEPTEAVLGRTEGDDADAPTVTFTSPVDGATIGHGLPLAADFSCADAMSGVRTCDASLEHAFADDIPVADGDALDTSVLGVHLLTVATTDWAYNSDEVTAVYVVEDQTDPTVTITSPAEGTEVLRGSPLVADYSCADEPDASAGLASCVGDVADGAAVDTSVPGPRQFTVVATDEWGNETTSTIHYEVVNPTCQGERVTVWLAAGDQPTDGDDVILGTHGRDVIAAGGGDDLVCALQGHDEVTGGPGADRVYLGPGDDDARGGAGADRLYGGPGNDRLGGGRGPDRVVAGPGLDVCRGGVGRDSASWCEWVVSVP